MEEEPIKRFHTPTLDDLRPLLGKDVNEETIDKVRAVLADEIDPCDASEACAKWVRQCYHTPSWHEQALEACNDLLHGHGVEALNIDGASSEWDEGVRMCPPFTYVNMGDTYIMTLARDHEHSAWVVACWGDLVEEYEREHKLGDHEEFDEEPSMCPSCGESAFTLDSHDPEPGEVKLYWWVCKSCNHHCQAVEGWEPSEPEKDEDNETE